MDSSAFPERLGAQVRVRRKELQLSQQELAELAGVSERFVRFVEQGKRSIQLDSLLVLLDTLGLELRLGIRTSPAARMLAGVSAGRPLGNAPDAISGAGPAGPGE